MVRLILTLNLLLSFFSFQSQENNLDWILKIMKNQSSDSYELLMMYKELPQELSYSTIDGGTISSEKSTSAFSYLDLSSKKSTLRSMSLNVHEICHGLTATYFFKEMKNNYIPHQFEDIKSYFFISNNIKITSIFKGKVFPSIEINSMIPSEMKTFRYDTYIEGNSSTQDEGIIGLLDEFNAYYHDSKFTFDMFELYKLIYPNDYLNMWVMELQSEMTAFFEFDYWIKEYLLFAKENYPKLFVEIMEKSQAFKIYKKIYFNYSALLSDYSKKVSIEKNNIEYRYSSEFWIDDYNKLINQLSKSRYESINLYLN